MTFRVAIIILAASLCLASAQTTFTTIIPESETVTPTTTGNNPTVTTTVTTTSTPPLPVFGLQGVADKIVSWMQSGFGNATTQIFQFCSYFLYLALLAQTMFVLSQEFSARGLVNHLLFMFCIVIATNKFERGINFLTVTVRDELTTKLNLTPSQTHKRLADAIAAADKASSPLSLAQAIKHTLISALGYLISIGALIIETALVIFQMFLIKGAAAVAPLLFALFVFEPARSIKVWLHLFALTLWPLSWAVGSIVTEYLLNTLVYTNSAIDTHLPTGVQVAAAEALPTFGTLIGAAVWFPLVLIALWMVIVIVVGPILLHIVIAGGGGPIARTAQMLVTVLPKLPS